MQLIREVLQSIHILRQPSSHSVIKRATTVNPNRQTADIINLPTNDRTRAIQIVKRVKRATDSKMSYLFDGLAMNAADALFEEMYGCQEDEKLSKHFNVTRALKVLSPLYRNEYNALMNQAWVCLINRRDKQSLPNPSDDVLEILRHYSERNENHYKILLEELRLRFSQLVDADIHFHPMQPGNFYLCFWYATEKLELSHDERKLLLPLFNRFVMDRFGQILSVTNQCMVEYGISPQHEKA